MSPSKGTKNTLYSEADICLMWTGTWPDFSPLACAVISPVPASEVSKNRDTGRPTLFGVMELMSSTLEGVRSIRKGESLTRFPLTYTARVYVSSYLASNETRYVLGVRVSVSTGTLPFTLPYACPRMRLSSGQSRSTHTISPLSGLLGM